MVEPALPGFIPPCLPTTTASVPEGDRWLHEIKQDGYRLVVVVHGDNVRLFTRNGYDWTGYFPGIARAVRDLGGSMVLDGELVACDQDGVPRFHELQGFLSSRGTATLCYFAFDMPFSRTDLRSLPLIERKEKLRSIIAQAPSDGLVRFSDHILGNGACVWASAQAMPIEGVVSKRIDSPYISGRTSMWLKKKRVQRQEFVVGGYARGTSSPLGSLLLGYYENGGLVYCGQVGAGLTEAAVREIGALCGDLEALASPFAIRPYRREAEGARWLSPELVVEVQFSGWSQDGRLRNPSFKGLRRDKPAREVIGGPVRLGA